MENSNNKGLVTLLAIVTIIAVLALAFSGYQYFSANNDPAVNQESEDIPTGEQDQDERNPSNNDEQNEPDETNNDTELKLYLYDAELYEQGDMTPFREVTRTTERTDVAAYVIEQIIFGPTDDEVADGLSDTFGTNTFAQIDHTAESTCAGGDYTVVIKGGDATVQFCRPVLLSGDLSGAIIKSQIEMTLKQFDTIDRVRILTHDGSCFNDMSGMQQPDACYN